MTYIKQLITWIKGLFGRKYNRVAWEKVYDIVDINSEAFCTVIQQFEALEQEHKQVVEAVTGVSDYMLGCKHSESELSDRPVQVEEKVNLPYTRTSDKHRSTT